MCLFVVSSKSPKGFFVISKYFSGDEKSYASKTQRIVTNKKSCKSKDLQDFYFGGWSHLGLNQGPSDYESDALTN